MTGWLVDTDQTTQYLAEMVAIDFDQPVAGEGRRGRIGTGGMVDGHMRIAGHEGAHAERGEGSAQCSRSLARERRRTEFAAHRAYGCGRR